MAQKNVLLPGVSGTTSPEFSIGGIPVIETIGTAQTAAETAQTAAETAQTAAETAQTTAETAQTTANLAAPLVFAIGTSGGTTTDTIPIGQRVKIEMDISTAYNAGVLGTVRLEFGEDTPVVILEDIPMDSVGVITSQYFQSNTLPGAATVKLVLAGATASQGAGNIYVNRQPAAISQGS